MENKKLYCDLHTHSTKSDGELTRIEVIELAIENNIGALAITDHNIPFDDINELQARYPEIMLINSSEISTSYKIPNTDDEKEIHIIALDFESTDHFKNVLLNNRFDSKNYVNSIIRKLRDTGIDIHFTYDDLRREMNQEFISRMAIARKLISLGIVSDIEEAFDEYIGDFGKRRAYVKSDVKRYIPMKSAIVEIRQAGGMPILCHPYSYNFSEEQVVRLIQDFKSIGGMAMEVLYSQYTASQQEQLRAYASEYGLLPSAASDFHGRGKKNSLNNRFPISIYYDLINFKRLNRYRFSDGNMLY